MSVVRTFAKFRPFTIQLEDGIRRSFDSLLFANIAETAKYATLSESGGLWGSRTRLAPRPAVSGGWA